jgi:tRNA/rRNA methyltransferase
MYPDLGQIRIILVEPAGELNVGSIARVMRNMGLERLVVVNPRCDIRSESARIMAVRGRDVLENAQIVPDLPTALAGCVRAIATTARDQDFSGQLEPPDRVLPYLFTPDCRPTALIFGREDRGLENNELNYAQRHLRIPVAPEYTSLNLAQAVGICAYELHRLAHASPQPEIAPPSPTIASLDTLEGYYQQLEKLLLDIGYLYPHTAPSRMQKIRQIYARAELSAAEVAMLRGIVSQVNWAINVSQQQD